MQISELPSETIQRYLDIMRVFEIILRRQQDPGFRYTVKCSGTHISLTDLSPNLDLQRRHETSEDGLLSVPYAYGYINKIRVTREVWVSG